MSFSGLDLALAIKERRFLAPLPPWVEHMRVHEENLVEQVEVGRIVSRWTPGRQFTVPDGYVQGGLICAVADGGQGLAVTTTLETFEAWVTLDLHIRFVRPIKAGQTVTLDSRVLSKTKNTAIAETTVMLEGDRLAAVVTGGWRKSETRAVLPRDDG
ncbi:MAG: PaaI family thioesterase [Hyphomonadaceae bacterium]|nr:PaaI family thioesterase [Hyphomonadaceae bacterium]